MTSWVPEPPYPFSHSIRSRSSLLQLRTRANQLKVLRHGLSFISWFTPHMRTKYHLLYNQISWVNQRTRLFYLMVVWPGNGSSIEVTVVVLKYVVNISPTADSFLSTHQPLVVSLTNLSVTPLTHTSPQLVPPPSPPKPTPLIPPQLFTHRATLSPSLLDRTKPPVFVNSVFESKSLISFRIGTWLLSLVTWLSTQLPGSFLNEVYIPLQSF